MNRTVWQVLGIAQRLLDDRKFKEAARVLGEVDLESISPEEKAFYCLVRSEDSLYMGNCAVEEHLDYSLRYYREKQDDENFARAKHLQGWMLSSRTQYFEARETLTEAVAAYRKCNSEVGQARVFSQLGYVYLQLGDLEAAENYFRRSGLYYKQQQDYARSSLVLISLASTSFICGRIQKGLAVLREVEPNISHLSQLDQGQFHSAISVATALTGDFAQAYRSLDRAIEILESYPREKARCLLQRGEILLLDDNPAKAEPTVWEGLRIITDINPAMAEAYRRLLAEVYLEMGKYEAAAGHVSEAMKLAEEMTDRSEIAKCHRIKAHLALEKSQEAEAREGFKEALEIFSRINHHFHLAVTRYQAATSGLFPSGEQHALLYLAREYFESEKLAPYIEKAKLASLTDVVVTRRPAQPEAKAPVFVAVNSEIKRLLDLARQAARSDIAILLTGPTGTGKDLLAEYIHYYSGRSGRFIAVNSAAIPENMIEAELFGYSRGAYTGADREKTGLIEEAHNGTLYLNEIADSSPVFQAKLLDALERKAIRRLGENTERNIAFRLIAATNHDIDEMVAEGRFRIDLYHRISEIGINLPTLADRLDDIPELVRHFLFANHVSFDLRKHGRELEAIYASFRERIWSGNVRQLKSEVARLALMTKGDIRRMPAVLSQNRPPVNSRERLAATLEKTGWNRRETARILGINEITVRRWIKKYDLAPPGN